MTEKFTDEEIEKYIHHIKFVYNEDEVLFRVLQQLKAERDLLAVELKEKEQMIRNFSDTLRISMETTVMVENKLQQQVKEANRKLEVVNKYFEPGYGYLLRHEIIKFIEEEWELGLNGK